MYGLDFLFVGGIVLFVLFGPWILLFRSNSSRRREHEAEQERWRELTIRVYALEEKVQALQKQGVVPSAEQVQPTVSEEPVVASQKTETPTPSPVSTPTLETVPEPSPPVTSRGRPTFTESRRAISANTRFLTPFGQ